MKMTIKVIPNAKKNEIIPNNPLTVKITTPPIKGKANKATIKLLSDYFNTTVTIIKGLKSPIKIIEIGEDYTIPKKNNPSRKKR
jgi:uncharacterized protein (TIGR00251 family)